MYVLLLEPTVSSLTYCDLDGYIDTAEKITEVDVSGLENYAAKGQLNGLKVCITGEIRPNFTSHWFNDFSIDVHSVEFLEEY